jgi:hypothetical protein
LRSHGYESRARVDSIILYKQITQITFKIRKHKRQNTQITFKIRRLCLMHELVRSPFEHKSDFVLIGRKKGLLGLQRRGTCKSHSNSINFQVNSLSSNLQYHSNKSLPWKIDGGNLQAVPYKFARSWDYEHKLSNKRN